jgi:glycogen(starch) synthase
MPRVLMTADAVGGVWTYALELARALAPHDLTVTLATMGPRPSADQVAAAQTIPELRLETSEFRLEWMSDAWADVDAAGEWLLDLERDVRPVIVHLNGYAHGALPWRSPRIAVGHSCVLSWRDAVGGTFRSTWIEEYRARVAHGLARADWVVAPTVAMLSTLRRHYGSLPRASVIANARSAESFRPATKEPVVFAAGRLWDRAKNIDALARVACGLSWQVVLAGAADENYAAYANVIEVGRLTEPQMADWVRRASIVALPARYEPFGLVALEAALAGCALVLGDIPSVREVWGDAASYVHVDDDRMLHRTIEALIADPAALRVAASRARQRALTYSARRMAHLYRSVYDCACGRHPVDRRSLPCAS